MRSIYFALVHLYINYTNIIRFISKTNSGKTKKAARLLPDGRNITSSRLLMKELNFLNVYQKNILHLLFVFKVKSSIIPR